MSHLLILLGTPVVIGVTILIAKRRGVKFGELLPAVGFVLVAGALSVLWHGTVTEVLVTVAWFALAIYALRSRKRRRRS